MIKGSRKAETVYWELIGKVDGQAPAVIQRYTAQDGGEVEAVKDLERLAVYYRQCWVVKVTVVTTRKTEHVRERT